MGKEVTFDYSKTAGFISAEEVKNMKAGVECAKEVLTSRTGAGNDFLGWIDLPVDYDKDEFARIKKAAAKIQSDSDVLLVIGIGGSYLGARAAIEFLTHSFYNVLDKGTRKTPQIFFVLDQSIEYGVRMSKLIDEVTKDMPEEQEDDGTESEN